MRFRFRGLSLRVDPSFGWALLVVTGCFGPLDLAEVPRLVVEILLVVLLREGVQAAVLSGARPRTILSAIGGHTTALRPVHPWRAAAALVVGPAALLLLSQLVPGRLSSLAWGWGLLSLAPIHPLPGGRLASMISPRISQIAVIPLAASQFRVHPAVSLVLAVSVVINLARLLRRPLAIDLQPDDAGDGAAHLAAGRLRQAGYALADAFDAAPSDHSAAQLARALLALERLDDATRLLEEPVAGPELFTQLMAALFYAGRYPEAARVGERSWTMEARDITAFNLACTYCRLEQPETAFSWLSQAIDAGWRDLGGLDEDPDLALLRTRPEWAPLRARLTSLAART